MGRVAGDDDARHRVPLVGFRRVRVVVKRPAIEVRSVPNERPEVLRPVGEEAGGQEQGSRGLQAREVDAARRGEREILGHRDHEAQPVVAVALSLDEDPPAGPSPGPHCYHRALLHHARHCMVGGVFRADLRLDGSGSYDNTVSRLLSVDGGNNEKLRYGLMEGRGRKQDMKMHFIPETALCSTLHLPTTSLTPDSVRPLANSRTGEPAFPQ